MPRKSTRGACQNTGPGTGASLALPSELHWTMWLSAASSPRRSEFDTGQSHVRFVVE